jgi:hypothetical protein
MATSFTKLLMGCEISGAGAKKLNRSKQKKGMLKLLADIAVMILMVIREYGKRA